MVYLDNSATTRPSQAVRDAMVHSMEEVYFNPSALYGPAMQVLEGIKRQLDPNGIMNPYKLGL